MTRKVVQAKAGEDLKAGEPVVFKAVKSNAEKVKLISYTVKATIPTGPYANVCPEITVSASSIEAAEKVVLPYINKLYVMYANGVPMAVESPKVTKTETPAPKAPVEAPKAENKASEPKVEATTLPVPPAPEAKVLPPKTEEQIKEEKLLKDRTEPFKKAYNALKSNKTHDGIDVIMTQIRNSTRLTDLEKDELLVLGLDLSAKLDNAARGV